MVSHAFALRLMFCSDVLCCVVLLLVLWSGLGLHRDLCQEQGEAQGLLRLAAGVLQAHDVGELENFRAWQASEDAEAQGHWGDVEQLHHDRGGAEAGPRALHDSQGRFQRAVEAGVQIALPQPSIGQQELEQLRQ